MSGFFGNSLARESSGKMALEVHFRMMSHLFSHDISFHRGKIMSSVRKTFQDSKTNRKFPALLMRFQTSATEGLAELF